MNTIPCSHALKAAGFKVGPELHTSGAAFLHQENGDPLPSMSWPTNYDRLASATMFSLFWAGDRLAPGITDALQGLPLQECLQGGFLGAMAEVARTLNDIPAVLGFETLNEPHPGWLGTDDLSRRNIGPITTGESPFQQMERSSQGAWASECLWARAGIWRRENGQNVLLDPARFQCNWMKQCFAPFVDRFTKTILQRMPDALIGVCPPAFGRESTEAFPCPLHPQSFWAPHFYDGIVLLGKVWTPDFGIEESPGEKLFNLLPTPVRPVLGLEKRVESYKMQLRRKCDFSSQEVPSILGEIGIPFELQYVGFPVSSREGIDAVNEAADAHMRALEEILLPHCWWNYTPENSKERGDFWNGEDLSIFANNEGRAPPSLIRPYLLKCCGVPVSQSFNRRKGLYRCEYKAHQPGETIFWVPSIHFPLGQTKVLATPGVEVAASQSRLLCRNGQYRGCVVIELRREE
ncbi:unnamed protein product [Durusdinium trenchii]|uniref:Glycoside hydrolase family 5 C-terminal domain-containing protein n=1 Tax=Durusdinium trenchii TaxID=1381693 RepID=A0ABP0PZL2_9DINO